MVIRCKSFKVEESWPDKNTLESIERPLTLSIFGSKFIARSFLGGH